MDSKLYLVRWPGLVASLVRASSPEHLAKILADEDTDDSKSVGDGAPMPTDYVVTEYHGPVYFDFTPPGEHDVARPLPDDVDVSEIHRGQVLDAAPGMCREGLHMENAIFAAAFPRIDAAIMALEGSFPGPDRSVPLEIIEAMRAEASSPPPQPPHAPQPARVEPRGGIGDVPTTRASRLSAMLMHLEMAIGEMRKIADGDDLEPTSVASPDPRGTRAVRDPASGESWSSRQKRLIQAADRFLDGTSPRRKPKARPQR